MVSCGTSAILLVSEGLNIIILCFYICMWGKIKLKKAAFTFDVSAVRDIIHVACLLHSNFCHLILHN